LIPPASLISFTAISVAFCRICPETAEEPDKGAISPRVNTSPEAASAETLAASLPPSVAAAEVEPLSDWEQPTKDPAIIRARPHANTFFIKKPPSSEPAADFLPAACVFCTKRGVCSPHTPLCNQYIQEFTVSI